MSEENLDSEVRVHPMEGGPEEGWQPPYWHSSHTHHCSGCEALSPLQMQAAINMHTSGSREQLYSPSYGNRSGSSLSLASQGTPSPSPWAPSPSEAAIVQQWYTNSPPPPL